MSLRHITAGMFMALAGALVLGGSGAQGAHPGTNGKIAFAGSGPSGLWSISSDGTDRTGLLQYDPDWDWYASFGTYVTSWRPDGQVVAFNGTPGGNGHPAHDTGCYDEAIWTVSPDADAIENLYCPTAAGGPPGQPYVAPYAISWSPDGSVIALDDAQYAVWNGDWGRNIYAVDVATGTLNTLFQAYYSDPSPPCPAGTFEEAVGGASWSPDGDRIAFARDGTVDAPPYECPAIDGLWTVKPDRSGLAQVTSGEHSAPDWSPDGSKILFVEVGETYGRNWLPLPGAIWVVDADGGNPTLLRAGDNSSPVWSPDGTKIAFVSISGATRQLMVMDADGSDAYVVPNTSDVRESRISWQPVVSSDLDADDDGVADAIDSGSGAFDDTDGTVGSITDANGLTVFVTDAADSGEGVTITVQGSSALKATFTICGFTVKISGGSDVTLTCSSIIVEVTEGSAEVELAGGDVIVTVPEGGKAEVDDLGGTFYSVSNLGSTDVTVTVDGESTILPAGDDTEVSSDTTAPTLSCNPASFLLNEPAATVTAAVNDSGSGPAASAVNAAADTSQAGTRAVLLTGEDLAGNESSISCGYSVSYVFAGFFQPIDNLPTVNQAKAGQTIPINWRIADYFGVGVPDPGSFTSVTTGSVTCDASDPQDAIETYAGNSGLQYKGSGNWQFNWKTPKSYATTCRIMRLNLSDGVSGRVAEFRFK